MDPLSRLLAAAKAVRRKAHAPYSGYSVGAALLGRNGKVYAGCNVENASYGLTICAERAACFQAVADGCREFRGLAVATEDGAPPCGACLQVAREFGPDLPILLAGANGAVARTTLARLLPNAFTARPRTTASRSPRAKPRGTSRGSSRQRTPPRRGRGSR